MKRILYSILLCAGLCATLGSCSNGDYIANQGSNGNNSVNPLNPLKADQFTWGGSGIFSVKINGNLWVADTAFYVMDTAGVNIVWAYRDSFRESVSLYMANTWSGNLYNMGFEQYNMMASWVPSVSGITSGGVYTSVLGNSGEMYMISNDTLHYNGKFYCQTVSPNGDIVNLSEGFFNVPKF